MYEGSGVGVIQMRVHVVTGRQQHAAICTTSCKWANILSSTQNQQSS